MDEVNFCSQTMEKKEELKSSQIEKTKDEYICITVRQSNSKIIYLIQMNWLWCLLLCAQKEKWIFWIKSEKSHWFNEAFLYARSRTYSIFFCSVFILSCRLRYTQSSAYFAIQTNLFTTTIILYFAVCIFFSNSSFYFYFFVW